MTTHTDDRFEERLLTELRAHVAHQAATASATAAAPPPGRRAHGGRGARRLARPRLAFGGAGVAVAVAAGIAIVATAGGGAQPAYAVEPESDGSVTVTIHSLTDASGLQRQLRAAGVNADVVKLEPGYVCGLGSGGGSLSVRVERPAPSGAARSTGGARSVHGTVRRGPTPPAGATSIAVKRAPDGTTTFTVRHGQVSGDEHLLVSTTTPAGQTDGALVSVAVNDDGGCTPIRAPAPPADTPGTP